MVTEKHWASYTEWRRITHHQTFKSFRKINSQICASSAWRMKTMCPKIGSKYQTTKWYYSLKLKIGVYSHHTLCNFQWNLSSTVALTAQYTGRKSRSVFQSLVLSVWENSLCAPRLTLFFVLSCLPYSPRVSTTSWCTWTARRGRRSRWTAPNACSALRIPTRDTAATTACRNTTTCKLTTSTRPREKQERERESEWTRKRETEPVFSCQTFAAHGHLL